MSADVDRPRASKGHYRHGGRPVAGARRTSWALTPMTCSRRRHCSERTSWPPPSWTGVSRLSVRMACFMIPPQLHALAVHSGEVFDINRPRLTRGDPAPDPDRWPARVSHHHRAVVGGLAREQDLLGQVWVGRSHTGHDSAPGDDDVRERCACRSTPRVDQRLDCSPVTCRRTAATTHPTPVPSLAEAVRSTARSGLPAGRSAPHVGPVRADRWADVRRQDRGSPMPTGCGSPGSSPTSPTAAPAANLPTSNYATAATPASASP
jgi:hypothetical protein